MPFAVAKPKNFKKTLLRTVKYFSRQYAKLILIFFLVLIGSILTLSAPYFIGKAVDTIVSLNYSLLIRYCLILLGIYISVSIVTFVQGFTTVGVSQKAVMLLRRDLFSKMQRFPLIFFDTRSHGDLMSRFSNDIDLISDTISQAILQIMTTVIVVTGSFIMMLSLSRILTFTTLLVVPLVFLLTRTVAKKTKPLFTEQQNELGKLNGQVEETISGIKIVKAFNKEEDKIEEFKSLNENLCEFATRAQILSGFIMPLMEVINNLGIAGIALVGGTLAIQGSITVGVIASFLSYSRQFTRPLNEVANMFNTLQSAMAGAERVFEILDEPVEKPNAPDSIEMVSPKGDVKFSHVYFGYEQGSYVLKDICFETKAGYNVALVGPTGAGKTTLANLLTRFYDIEKGEIFIDGENIDLFTKESLRESFGIVLQDTYLFSGSIKENILYGKPDATDEEIIRASTIADADTFIRQLPKGYDTILTESGSNLSQGQRQLLAIARAVLSNPPFLILDEATSDVDTRTEIRIQEGMKKLMEGKTSFIIAHRLSTIRNCQLIMVISGGEIVEKGNHEELLKLDGVYSKMYAAQFV
ncbi:MAG: ABC transporter ATP-binding protein/permease [Oscillospiraceae bacterium]|nr:ABC transporter ATP-binding protein/permease [Oscillospiraceae bacterium]